MDFSRSFAFRPCTLPHIISVPLTFFLRNFCLPRCRPASRKRSVYCPAALHLGIRSQIDSQLDIHQSLDRLLGMTMPSYHCIAEHSSYPTAPPSSIAHIVSRKLLAAKHCANTSTAHHRTRGISPASKPPFVDRTRAKHRSAAVDHPRQL